MKNEDSYTEKMKRKAIESKKKEMFFDLDVYIQMILDEALFKRQLELLMNKVNYALDHKDEELFYKYSNEYNKLVGSL